MNDVDDDEISMFEHMDMSPREVAARFRVSVELVRDILQRDLAEVLRPHLPSVHTYPRP